jgi:predicted amidohydrolase
MRLCVSGAQIPVTEDVKRNVDTIIRAIQYAAEHSADLLLTPEGSLSGYTPDFNCQEVNEGLQLIVEHASTHGLGLALGTCYVESHDSRCYNQIRFYNKDGEFLGFHSKILRCGSLNSNPEGEISQYSTSALWDSPKNFRIQTIYSC